MKKDKLWGFIERFIEVKVTTLHYTVHFLKLAILKVKMTQTFNYAEDIAKLT